jgi:hypothetical protein
MMILLETREHRQAVGVETTRCAMLMTPTPKMVAVEAVVEEGGMNH